MGKWQVKSDLPDDFLSGPRFIDVSRPPDFGEVGPQLATRRLARFWFLPSTARKI